MEIKRVINVTSDAAAARDRILSFFTRTGYRLAVEGETLEFRRGSVLGTMFSTNPSSWDCKATVCIAKEADSSQVSVTYTVRNDPFENTLTRTLWNEEADLFAACLVKDSSAVPDVKENTRRVQKYILKTVGIPGAVFLILVIAAAVAAILLLTK